MKVKTSITLSEDVLAAADRMASPGESRSAFIERAVRELISGHQRARGDARELAALNRHAARLNTEASDVLGYQTALSAD